MKKFLASISLGLISALLLSGCAPSPEQKALEADCELIGSRLVSYIDILDTDSVEGWSWGPGYAVTNAGTTSRQNLISDAESLYPFFPVALENFLAANAFEELEASNFDSQTYSGLYTGMAEEAVRLEYLNTILAGTQFELEFTPEQNSLIYSQAKDGSELIDDKIDELFGESFPETEKEAGVCGGMTIPSLEELASTYSSKGIEGVNVLFRAYIVSLEHMPEMGVSYFKSVPCQITGSFAGKPCASSDFDPGPFEWVPTTQDPFIQPYQDQTLQGIAEFYWCDNQGLEVNSSRTGCS